MAAAERARPSEAIEDYAKAIYSLSHQGDGTATTNALAERHLVRFATSCLPSRHGRD